VGFSIRDCRSPQRCLRIDANFGRAIGIGDSVINRFAWLAVFLLAALPVRDGSAANSERSGVEEIVISGSRIVREDYRSPSPIVTVSEELFEQSGAATVESVLNSLPQFVPSLTSTSNNPSNRGQANVELRGLGTERTLVLLDGRRLVPANGTGVVDLNMLPASIIENVEIITGGGSAVYGSDAIAGVVNFRTKDFEGVEVESNYGETARGDGEEWSFSVTAGSRFGNGRGHALVSFGYADRSAVRQGDRDFSRISLGYDPGRGFEPVGSATIEEGSVSFAPSRAAYDEVFAGRYGTDAASHAMQTRFGFNADGSLFTAGDDSPGSVINYRGERTETFNDANYTYNFAPPNYLQLPLERKSFFGSASYQVADAFEMYAQAIYANYSANTQLAPTPASGLYIPVTNPYVPADLAYLAASRVTPEAPFVLAKRMTEVGQRIEHNDYESYQVVTGARGNITPAWVYDFYVSKGETRIDSRQLGNVSRSRFEALTFAPDGGVATCGGLDPFGPASISPGCAAYVSVSAENATRIRQTLIEATLTGDLVPLPGGMSRAAVGILYRKDAYGYEADDALKARTVDGRADTVGFNPEDNVSGSTDLSELYLEMLIPLVSGLPGMESLVATLGYRYGEHSTVGGIDAYKAELSHEIVSGIRLRGSYQRAVRAPNIASLYSPESVIFPSIRPGDPCNLGSPERTGGDAVAVRDLCLAQGLPGDMVDSYNNPNDQVLAYSGGNPGLIEEKADTASFGIVFQSSPGARFGDLQASIDYYSIDIRDAIDAILAETSVSRCYDVAFNPTLSAANSYCRLFNRSAATGEITDVLQTAMNLGALETSGIDLQFDWRFEAGPGQLSFNWIATWLERFERQELAGELADDYGGTIGSGIASAFPDWKWAFNLGYDWGVVGVNARWRYIAGLVDRSFNGQDLPRFFVGATSYYDFTANFALDRGLARGLTVRAGVANLSDVVPPFYPSWAQANTDPSTYDALGRRYFVSFDYSF
jgi:outer membrane receptor protein involved in Fe transport